MNTVIFASVHSAGRSQMATAFFNLLADPTKVRAVSARTAPAAQVHPEVIAAMAEVGLDLRNAGGYFRIAPYRATQLSLDTLIPPFVPDAQRRAIEAKRPDPCDRVAASSRRPTHPGAVRLGRPAAGFGNTTTSGDHLAIAVVARRCSGQIESRSWKPRTARDQPDARQYETRPRIVARGASSVTSAK
jgi:hypothetical protein